MGQVRSLVNLLRSRGFLIVLDDVGSGHSNLIGFRSSSPIC
jgi:EAL domain-containing protein (putative c-di-GMP-specific phosphodiesterase class I)